MMTCNGCGADTSATTRQRFCWSCLRKRVFIAIQEQSFFISPHAKRVEADEVLYVGKDSYQASLAIELKAADLRLAGREHYYLYVTDNFRSEVSSISR